ncbi:splicing factor 3A subunit 3 [Cryptococcus neoformans]|nr:splicing factor 3A subunit 3 [Cryptococcus neoformans var. grubii]OWZ31677.1 splicing factor 3A subunit 3 [Cryptococcus neoformans var. grubii c45]
MDSIIETQRQTHESIERYEQALAEVLMQNPTATKNVVRRDRKAGEILGRIGTLRKELVEQYEDIPGLRPRELALLSAPAPGEDDLAEFYTRFNKIKDFHSRNAGINARQFINELDELVKGDGVQVIQVEGEEEPTVVDPLDSVFSGEEAYGKHLDLYLSHSQYLNLKGSTRLSYVAYLDMLKHGKVERTLDIKEKSNAAYLEYVQTLYTYLLSFFERALPLVNIQKKVKEEEQRFETAWEADQVDGWENSGVKKQANNGEGIWCQYCQKSYSKQTVYDAHLNSKGHKKKAAEGQSAAPSTSSPAPTTTPNNSNRSKLMVPARLTFLITALLTFPPIPQLLSDSRNEVERKMALTAREREQEIEEQEEGPAEAVELGGQESDEESDDGKIYNPLKLPLGWDGKPIPYWLYKLHGLGVEFSCEICSNATYNGRKAFEKHFMESKHAFGLRALGLPPSKHFMYITKINDALALAEKLKREGRQEITAMDKAEEFEDEEGNVYDKRTYEQLQRQGLI